tara:strand:- start:1511 stop:1834 length:324 start_codon:yes stop_codon:yes gene_type:complete
MSLTHLIRNQDGHYWGRGKRWVDGRDSARVTAFDFRDEAANTLFELSSKDIDMRGELLPVNRLEGKLPKLEISSIPLPADENTSELPPEIEVTEAKTVTNAEVTEES